MIVVDSDVMIDFLRGFPPAIKPWKVRTHDNPILQDILWANTEMKTELTKENVWKNLRDGAKSMSELYRALGGQSKASGSFSKKMRESFPSVDAQFKKNGGQPSPRGCRRISLQE